MDNEKLISLALTDPEEMARFLVLVVDYAVCHDPTSFYALQYYVDASLVENLGRTVRYSPDLGEDNAVNIRGIRENRMHALTMLRCLTGVIHELELLEDEERGEQ